MPETQLSELGRGLSPEQAEMHFIRLIFEARTLAEMSLHGLPDLRFGRAVCLMCGHFQKDRRLPGIHYPMCALGAVTAHLVELSGLAPGAPRRDSGTPAVPPEAPGKVVSIAAAAEPIPFDRAAARGVNRDAPGYQDFGEPWRMFNDGNLGAGVALVDADGLEVYAAGVTDLHETDEARYARRIAAAVNLCAGMPTESLEQAFEQITAQSSSWALIAMSRDNLGTTHIDRIRRFIDGIIAEAAREAAVAVQIGDARP